MIPIGDVDRPRGVPLAVLGIIGLNIWVFVLETNAAHPNAFINSFALIPYDLTRDIVLAPPSPPSPWLTLITSQFLHDGLLHIGSNMLFLFVFGPEVEALTGGIRFVWFYLTCGVLAGLAQLSVMPMSHVPSIGASGAIAGVLGAYLLHFPTHRVQTIIPIGCFPLFLRLPALLVIGLWAVTQFMHGFGTLSTRVLSEQGGGIAYFAHIGGFLSGVLLIGFFAKPSMSRGRVGYRLR
ncbi:MAG TPA: rhomboid family intramembrane serine protease [Candidatus Acidoferrales bacterium]|nr:rhomboid family intramembrane serine protease [Candidatus Acidoferrales bacterium]